MIKPSLVAKWSAVQKIKLKKKAILRSYDLRALAVPLTLKTANQSMHYTPAHDDAPQYQVWWQTVWQFDLHHTFTVKKTCSPDIMGALTPMVFKEGFLTTPFTECRGCPGTHTFKEGLSHSVHRGCPGIHTLKEGLSHSVHRGCLGTHTFKEGLSHPVHRGCPGTHTFKEGLSCSVHYGCTGTHIMGAKICSISFSGMVCNSLCA